MDTLSMFVYCQVPRVPDGAIQYCLSVSQQLLVMGDQLFNSNGRSKIMLKQKKIETLQMLRYTIDSLPFCFFNFFERIE